MRESVPHISFGRPVAVALVCLLLVGSIGMALAREPASVSGRATVIDGDTLDIDGERVRLEGIDAPEAAQTCARAWFGTWRCGAEAVRQLGRLVDGRRVTCEAEGRDKYGRLLGICFVDGREINADLVRSGLAWAFLKYSDRYLVEQKEAQAAKAGVWQAETEPAWVYREKRWTVAEETSPDGCAIKGNVTEHGHIYHMPWSPWYGKVRVEAAKGERWFCSEADAAKAGFRPALQH